MALCTASQKSSRVHCPCLRNGLLPFQHGGLWSRALSCPPRTSTGSGSAPTVQMEPLYRSGQQKYINIVGQKNKMWPPTYVTSRSGRTSGRMILDRILKAPEPTGRTSCCPKGEESSPPAPYGVRPARTGAPGCAGMRSSSTDGLLRGRGLPDSLHPCDRLTGANGAGPWECTAGVPTAPTRTRTLRVLQSTVRVSEMTGPEQRGRCTSPAFFSCPCGLWASMRYPVRLDR